MNLAALNWIKGPHRATACRRSRHESEPSKRHLFAQFGREEVVHVQD